MTRFVNVNLLRLQDSEQTIQGVLYLVEDKTRDVTLRQELIGANAAKDQFLALSLPRIAQSAFPGDRDGGRIGSERPRFAETRHALEVIRRNVELEARLIDDLLDVTRISKGKLQLSFETVCVHEILQRAYEICREEINAKRLEDRISACGPNDAFVEGDPARLQQVFWNLIKNSVKFTPATGRIMIETSNPSAGQIEIRITDTGIGIEAEKIGRDLQRIRAGAKLDHAAFWRPRPWPRHFKSDGRSPWRQDPGGERRQGSGRNVHVSRSEAWPAPALSDAKTPWRSNRARRRN